MIARSKNISTTQGYLYLCLLNECNQRIWPASFDCSNRLLCALTGIQEKTLIEARKKLQEFGLIKFEPGITKKKSPTYYLLDNCNKVSNNDRNTTVKTGVLNGTYNKTIPNKIKIKLK